MSSEISKKADEIKRIEERLGQFEEALRRVEGDLVSGIRIQIGGLVSLDISVGLDAGNRRAVMAMLRSEQARMMAERRRLVSEMSALTKRAK